MADRDEHGRFVPGNKAGAGAGRPRLDAQEKIQNALIKVVSNGTLDKWVAKTKQRIEHGDLKAAEFVFDRLIGKPLQRQDNTFSQLDELRALLWGSETDDPQPGE